MNPALYEELTFSWKRKLENITFEHRIYNDMILNFYQAPLGFTNPNKATLTDKDSQFVPVANINDKRQITGTFCVNISSDFCLFRSFPEV